MYQTLAPPGFGPTGFHPLASGPLGRRAPLAAMATSDHVSKSAYSVLPTEAHYGIGPHDQDVAELAHEDKEVKMPVLSATQSSRRKVNMVIFNPRELGTSSD